MAPVPVEEMGMVTVFPVWKTWRSISHTSSITWKNTGSRCPTTGWVMARRTRGCTVHGPAPSRSRFGASNSSAI